MSPRESDAALVEALRAGHSDAFERLYGEYSAPIYNLCARVVCDCEEAKDLTQDVFITAFNQLRDPTNKPVRKLKPWLYRVATNACYNHLRSRKHLGGGDADLENASCEVDEYQRAETVALVEASLGQLNERYRTALVLKDLQGLEPAEIAEVMEVSRPNADVLVHRARASFKAAFANLAGDVPAPAALGMVLLPLSLPAALRAMPSFAHPAAPPVHAPAHAPHAPVGHGLHLPGLSHAGPGGAGLLAKIGAALTTKVGIAAAAATVVIGGAVAVTEVQHSHANAHRWTGASAHAWQAPYPWSRWDKQWARWSLYGYWMQHGWPMGWNSGRWMWNGRSGGWSWRMSNGSTWSSGGTMSASSSWSGGSGGGWTMTMSRSGSSGWSSGGSRSGSSSSSKNGSGGSWSGGGSSSGGSWKGSSSGSGSGSGWNGGSGSGSSGGSGSGWNSSGSGMGGGGSGSGW